MVETKGQRIVEGRPTDQMMETKGQRRVEGRQQIRWWKLKDTEESRR